MNEVIIEKEFDKIKDTTLKITKIEAINYQYGVTYIFDIGIAQKYGVNEAIFLQNLIFWLRQNKANNKNCFQNKYWTYNTRQAFQKLFPFWSESQIKRIIDSLKNKGLIEVGHFSSNIYDRTNYYTVKDQSLLQIDCPNQDTSLIEVNQSIDRNRSMINTDINTDNKPYINNDIDEIYNIYPNRCINSKRSTNKCSKDKLKIKALLKSKNKNDIIEIMELYLNDCNKNKIYLKNFSTFLNNFPDKENFINNEARYNGTPEIKRTIYKPINLEEINDYK